MQPFSAAILLLNFLMQIVLHHCSVAVVFWELPPGAAGILVVA